MTNNYYNAFLYFADVASAHKDNAALCYPEQLISYEKLYFWAERLAQFLIQKGYKRGDVVAIGHNKRPLSYALMLAALKLGMPYVCLDVGSPVRRTSDILETSSAALLAYDDPAYETPMHELAELRKCPLILLSEDMLPDVSSEAQEQLNELAKQVDGATIAYIMFTSGSTGKPKGVAVTHQNVLHFIEWGKKCFDVSPKDNFANLSPMYFDNSVFDFYVGLFSGAALSPTPRELLAKPYELVAYVRAMNCSIWFSVPSLLIYLMTMKALPPGELPSLRSISFGGEGYPKVELKKLYDLFSRQAQLVNVYGPTECTCICSAHRISDSDFDEMEGLPTLGRLNQNFDYCIIDDDGNESDTGELWLIGPNVAAGYFNDLERTAAVFHTLADAKRFMKRAYKTGDIVREHEGRLYFVGRKDNQIKHMGYRIELEEIEHALMKIKDVSQASVIYHKTNSIYGKLIAFVAYSGDLNAKKLLVDLADFIPEYMVPSKIEIMDTLPKSPNGKVDKQHLITSLNI